MIRRIEADGTSSERWLEATWNYDVNRPSQTRILRCTSQPCDDAHPPVLETRTDFGYDSAGKLLFQCMKDPGNATALAFDCASATAAPAGVRRSRYTYCTTAFAGGCGVLGSLRTVDGPREDVADITTFNYYASDSAANCVTSNNCNYRQGDRESVVNAGGHVTSFLKYDQQGHVLRMSDPNQVIVDMTYNLRGWLRTRTVRANAGLDPAPSALDATTTVDYTAFGAVERVTDAMGVWTQYTYDNAQRLVAISDPVGNRIDYELDNAGNRTREQTRDASNTLRRNLKRQFNSVNRMVKLFNANEVDFVGYQHDEVGNPKQVTDQLGNITAQAFDPLNRLIQTIQDQPHPTSPDTPDPGTTNATTAYLYDARGNMTRVTDPNKLVTGYTFNGLGDRTHLASPDTGYSEFSYDAAGNVEYHYDARNINTHHHHDALNRLVTWSGDFGAFYYLHEIGNSQCGTHFPKGRLVRVLDGPGGVSYCYDRRGNLTRKIVSFSAASGFPTTGSIDYSYDLADRMLSITYPSGAQVTLQRDAAGRVVGIQRTQSGVTSALVTSVTYRPFGPIASVAFGSGELLTKNWDLDYRPLGVTLSQDFSLSLTTDKTGDIVAATQITGGSTKSHVFDYDDLHRIIAVRDPEGPKNQQWVTRWTYDLTGNRLSQTQGFNGTPQLYTYANQPLTPVLPYTAGYEDYAHQRVDRPHDATGNLTSGVTGQAYDYDSVNRMKSVTVSGLTLDRLYNHRSQRAIRFVPPGPGRDRQFVATWYDEDGHTIQENEYESVPDSAGGQSTVQLTRSNEYVWLNETPVAVIQKVGSGPSRTVFLVTDHLNSPRVARDASSSVWRWNMLTGDPFSGGSSVFGEIPAIGVGSNPVVMDLRFPGQLWDQETGLQYNYYRDYEAATGRYVESDPIGLAAGVQTYAYANSRPTSVTDKFGLYSAEGMQLLNGLNEMGRMGEPYIPECFRPDLCNTSLKDCLLNCREALMPGAPTSPFGLLAEGAGTGSAISAAAGGGFLPVATGMIGGLWAGWNMGCLLSCGSPCNYPNAR